MRIVKITGILAVFSVLFTTCRKNTKATWDVDVVLPVVTSELNIKNFFGDSLFKADNSHLLSLSVTRTITAIKLDSLIKLPDTTIVSNFTIPAISYTMAPGASFPALPPSPITFSISNNAAIKTVIIHKGVLHVKFMNSTRQPLEFTYVVPSATKNGDVFKITEVIPPFTGTANPYLKDYDMKGYTFNMKTGTMYNTITQNYTVKNAGNDIDTVFFGKGVKTEISYSGIIPEYIDGYFGEHDISLPLDSTRLDILKSFESSNFMLSDASLLFRIMNEFGCEFTGTFSNIKSINGNSTVMLNTNQLSNLNINSATRVGSVIFPAAKTVSFTPLNSNIISFLSNLPDKLSYSGNIKVNPLGNLGGYSNFAYYNTGIKVLADINIPLRFNAEYFKLISFTKVDFANVLQLENVNYGDFIITANNRYPFRAKIQAYMIDESNQVIDSLFVQGNNVIASGIINNQNIVTDSVITTLHVPLNTDKISHLKSCRQIKLETYFIMPPNPPDIQIYEDNKIKINIVADINYRAERK